MTVRDVAELYEVSENTVLTWLHNGSLRGVNVAPDIRSKKPKWRISQAAIDAFEELRTPSPPLPRAPRRKRHGEVIEFYR